MQDEDRKAWAWSWAGIGALGMLGAALASGAARSAELAPPGSVAVWVADRDAGALYGLDADLILARTLPLGWPLDIERAHDGGLFVLRSGNQGSSFGHRLVKLDPAGNATNQTYLEPCLDLDTLDGRAALLIELPGSGGGPRRAVRVAPEGALFVVAASPTLRCITGSRNSVLTGSDDGWIVRWDPQGGAPITSVQLGGAIGDLRPGPEAGSVFALDTSARRLAYLGPDLALRWQVMLGIEARHLGVVEGEERVWIADTSTPRVVRYGPGGALELDRGSLPLAGLDRSLPWLDGGVLLAAPGAILHLDGRGHLAPGQGGFNHLADLER